MIVDQTVIEAHNFDMTSIITPINIDAYARLLKASNFDPDRSKQLVTGFQQGFDLGYRGPTDRQDLSNNLKLRVGNNTELWNKVIKEVKEKRICGPFKKPPFDYFIQSPLGKVCCEKFCECIYVGFFWITYASHVKYNE